MSSNPKSGQAMLEFVIALVGIMLVVAGVLTVAELNKANTDTLVRATERAIFSAMGNPIAETVPEVRDWAKGPDGRALTKDDELVRGSFDNVRHGITTFTAPNSDWTGTERLDGADARYKDVSDMNFGLNTAKIMGFASGSDEESVETLPVSQTLLGLPEIVDVRNETYMPATGGLY